MIPMAKMSNPKVQELLTLMKDPEVQEFMNLMFYKFLTSPQYQILKKIALVMDFNGLDVDKHCVGSDWEWDNMEPFEQVMNKDKKKTVLQPIPDQLALLSERINDASLPVLRETILVDGNKTEVRARLLRDKLSNIPYQNGKKFMLGTEVQKFFLSEEVREDQRIKKKGIRQSAMDVMRKAVEQFPDEVRLGKNDKNRNFIEYIERPYN
jgi:hypothetical protein